MRSAPLIAGAAVDLPVALGALAGALARATLSRLHPEALAGLLFVLASLSILAPPLVRR